jgi:hypothetical protein
MFGNSEFVVRLTSLPSGIESFICGTDIIKFLMPEKTMLTSPFLKHKDNFNYYLFERFSSMHAYGRLIHIIKLVI